MLTNSQTDPQTVVSSKLTVASASATIVSVGGDGGGNIIVIATKTTRAQVVKILKCLGPKTQPTNLSSQKQNQQLQKMKTITEKEKKIKNKICNQKTTGKEE